MTAKSKSLPFIQWSTRANPYYGVQDQSWSFNGPYRAHKLDRATRAEGGLV